MTFDPTPTPLEELPAEYQHKEQKNSVSGKPFCFFLFQTIVIAVLLYFAIDAVFARVKVLNISMQPTLVEGNIILVNKLAYTFGDMQIGDVVIFHAPNNRSEDFIKRLIGKPGDFVEVRNGQVFVNSVQLDEPYIAAAPDYNGAWMVPEGMIFVLGDNRNQSSDSHVWGFVPIEDVVGKALVIYWPPSMIGLVTHHQPVLPRE